MCRAARVLCICTLAALWPALARADGPWQGSARLGLGFGARIAEGDSESVHALSLRGDALTEASRLSRLRYGPGVELRTASFSTFEAGAGLSLSVKLAEDAAFGAQTLLGGAYRDDRRSTATLAQLLTIGYVDRTSRPRYAPSLSLFLSVRTVLSGGPLVEITGGAEVDMLFIATPFVLLRDRIRGR